LFDTSFDLRSNPFKDKGDDVDKPRKTGKDACSKWSNDLVQEKGIEKGIECIDFKGFDQVRFEGSIKVLRRGPNTSYSCARGAQSNLIWAIR